ncbi:MAG TPA: class F sortase [Streptosporangiaceae bacterium]
MLPIGAVSVQIPSLRISASASPESVSGGALAVPSDPADVGWWMPSTAELVIDGHVDMEGAGPGALYEVRNLHPGAQVVIQTASGPEHWTIEGVRTYQKGHVPAGLFSWQGTDPRLVIITCGGPFDYSTHHYYDNVVAYASGG